MLKNNTIIDARSLFYLSKLPKGHTLLVCSRDRANDNHLENFLAMDIIVSDPDTHEFFRIVVSGSRFWRNDWENIVGVYAAADHSQVLRNLTFSEMIEVGEKVEPPEANNDLTLTHEQLVKWAPQFLVWELGELAANDKNYFTLRTI